MTATSFPSGANFPHASAAPAVSPAPLDPNSSTLHCQDERIDIAVLLSRFGTGGVERVGCLLQNGVAERGLRAEVLTVSRDGPVAELLGSKVRITELGEPRWATARRSVGLLLSVPTLVRHLRRTRPRILLSPGNHTHIAATLAHWLAGSDARLVLKITNPLLKKQHGATNRWFRRIFYRWAFGRAAQVLVLSRRGEQQIGEIGRDRVKARFVHNPYVAFSAAPESGVPESDIPTILSIGRLTAQKNHAQLLRALARLAHRKWRLVVLGEGPLEGQLRALAGELAIADRVEFRGFVADPAPFYRAAHVLALPSDWEDLPAVVLEALAVGVPVVATACSEALADVMREAGQGRLTPPGDINAFASALEQIIMQPPTRTPFSDAWRYSIENGINDHLAALQPLLR